MNLGKLLGRGDEDEEYPVERDTVETALCTTFNRRTETIHFIRGDPFTLTYDVFDGRDADDDSGFIGRISEGIRETERVGIPVEKYYTVCTAKPVREHGTGPMNVLYGSSDDELTPGNVNARSLEKEEVRTVVVPVELPVKRRGDTGEIVWRGTPSRRGDVTIVSGDVRDEYTVE